MRLVQNTSETRLSFPFEIEKNRLHVYYKNFADTLSPYVIWDVLSGDVQVGAILVSPENYVHICIHPKYRKSWAGKWVREFLISQAKEKPLHTSVNAEDNYRLQFAKRLGFVEEKTTACLVTLTFNGDIK